MQKARPAFTNLRLVGSSLPLIIYQRSKFTLKQRSALLYGSETWVLQTGNIRRLSVYEHRRVRSVARVQWRNCVCGFETRCRALDHRTQSLEEAMNLNELTWLGSVTFARAVLRSMTLEK